MTKKTKRARIYLDYASLTPVDRRVLNDMVGYYSPEYANPSSIYREGVMAGKALEEARKSVAGFIHARPDEIVFTGG
ncbi:MAG: aminotransferase class V-fold PLP-dependent enzyme, partial [Patescibacteria group bacterium]|nr:aminotransferase class V-fold PLP-dependent enzyme [Patescibacteria group bacterium]